MNYINKFGKNKTNKSKNSFIGINLFKLSNNL